MAECRWLKPLLVGQFEFVEWTEDGHLRHSRFVGLREDRKTTDVLPSPSPHSMPSKWISDEHERGGKGRSGNSKVPPDSRSSCPRRDISALLLKC
jgi:hypothetical protein